MSTMKNGQISQHCNFNKIIKAFATSFQSPAMSKKHVINGCHTAHQYLAKFHYDSTQDLKEISLSVTPLCSNAYDDVTDFEIGGFHKNTKIYIS